MARNKRLYPTGRLILKVNRASTDKDKLYPIHLQYTWNRNPFTKQTGLSCRACDWNAKGNGNKGCVKSSYGPDYIRVNKQLMALLAEYDGKIFEYHQKHPNQLNSDAIRAILHDKPITRSDDGKDFVDFGEQYLKNEHSRNKIGISTFKNGLSSFNIFRQFLSERGLATCGTNSIYIGDLSEQMIDDYINYRRNTKGNSDETINHALTPIIKAITDAANQGLADKTTAVNISNMRISIKPKLDEEQKKDVERHLTQDQIVNLIDYYKNCKEPRRKEYLEIFFFAYYACGLRCVDAMTLRWSDIDMEKKELRKILIKTTKRHTIPLNEQAIQILNTWKGRHQKFVFGLLSDDFNLNNTEALYLRRNSIEQSINQSLKVVGEKLGLDFSLTMHVARHSFAIHALNSGISLYVVSRLLGHSSTTITEQVYAKYLPETLAEEVSKLKFESLMTTD